MPPGTNEAAAMGNEVVRLQQDNLLLEHRVEAMRNTEQNLKERLNQTTSLLDQERRHNQALKGA
jgi:predicted RNase H-like nuclease (RuvC/YqgF family)